MTGKLNRNWWTALAASFVVILTGSIFRSLASDLCGGTFIYPLDDSYIHIAMAKTLAEHGVWGVEATAPAFCSSSPLWTVLLTAFYFVFGISEILPWYLSLAFNIGSVVVVDRLLARYGKSWMLRLGGALLVAFAAPIITTTALGMEHAMHGFFILALIWALDDGDGKADARLFAACAFGFLATASRYESLFVILPFALGAALVRKRISCLLVPVISGLPVFIYGIWAVCAGGRFLPNSLLLKGQFMSITDIIFKTLGLFTAIPEGAEYLYVMALLLIVVMAVPGTRLFWRIACAAMCIAVAGHIVFASVLQQFCRYEAYLTASGATVAILGIATGSHRSRIVLSVKLVPAIVAAGFFAFRAYKMAERIAYASEDIYSQQVQMATIMSRLPAEDRGCIAINDLGYMALHAGNPFLDIWGLGSQDMTELLLNHPAVWSTEELDAMFKKHGVKYMVVFEKWYPIEAMPKGVENVAYLLLKDPLICGTKVSFRATSPEYADRLRQHLITCPKNLPRRATLAVSKPRPVGPLR